MEREGGFSATLCTTTEQHGRLIASLAIKVSSIYKQSTEQKVLINGSFKQTRRKFSVL
jgi:hypothetical protein